MPLISKNTQSFTPKIFRFHFRATYCKLSKVKPEKKLRSENSSATLQFTRVESEDFGVSLHIKYPDFSVH